MGASALRAEHPGTTDRINDISARVAKMGGTAGIVDDPAYQDARRHLGV